VISKPAPLAQNEWMHSALDPVSENENHKENPDKNENEEEEKQPKLDDSEDDAAIITKNDRKHRNKTKWFDRKADGDNDDKEGMDLESLLEKAIIKNKTTRRKNRQNGREKSQNREDSVSPSPSPDRGAQMQTTPVEEKSPAKAREQQQQPEKKSPSKWKAMRRKQYEEPDLL